MNPAAAAPRRIRSSLAAYLWPGTIAALLLAAGLLAIALLQRRVAGGLPWQAALAIAGLVWLIWSSIAGLFAAQSVWLHADGTIEVRGAGTGFRRRRFAAAEVQFVHLAHWTALYRSPAGRLLLQLKAAPHRDWTLVGVVDSAPFSRSDGALFQAVLDAIALAQPGRRLPVARRAG